MGVANNNAFSVRLADFDTAGILARRAHPCWRKTRFRSRGAAAAQLRSLARRGFLNPAEFAAVYNCRHCGAFHTGRLRKIPRPVQGALPFEDGVR